MLDTHGNSVTLGYLDQGPVTGKPLRKHRRRCREGGRRLSDYAVRSCQEVANILHERGVLKSSCRNVVIWYERQAFKKIRDAFPELAWEVER